MNEEVNNETTETVEEVEQDSKVVEDSNADGKEKLLSQDEVNEIVKNRVNRILAEKEKEVAEAKKLAKMNADEKAEYQRQQLESENQALKTKLERIELAKETNKMLLAAGIKTNDVLVDALTGTDAETTKTLVTQFVDLFNESVDAAVKEQLAGTTPRKQVTKTDVNKSLDITTMSYDDMATLKENNPDLFKSLIQK